MSGSPWPEVKRVLGEALDLPPAERAPFLDRACVDSPTLRQSVQELLDAHDGGGTHLDPDDAMTAAELLAAAGPLRTGETVGRYRVGVLIGVGGMGAVYRAEDESLHRPVALKVLATALTRTSLRRFHQEMRVLAELNHTGIARIFDSGLHPLATGITLPYFAMELVEAGVPITTWCENARASLAERLALFADVCDAVAHGHAKGIIHRDLKPGNILVGDGGRPKVIDFGVARTLTAPSAATLRTHTGQIVGTLRYMSPEQAAGSDSAVDIRSDVYALGVVLFEVLTDSLPYELDDSSIAHALRMIQDAPPLRLGQLKPELRGDLESVLLKALDKDPQRRYQTAGDFASDLRRYLRDEPVVARPPSASHQFRLFAKRHKALVGGVAAVLLVLMLGIIGTTVGLLQARRAQATAQLEASRAQRTASFLANAIRSVTPGEPTRETFFIRRPELSPWSAWLHREPAWESSQQGGALTISTLLANIGSRLEQDFADEPLLRADLASLIGSSLGNRLDPAAERWLTMARDLRREHLGLTHEDTIRANYALCSFLLSKGDGSDVVPAREAYEGARQSLGLDHPATLVLASTVALALQNAPRQGADVVPGWTFLRELYDELVARHGPDDVRSLTIQSRISSVLTSRLGSASVPTELESLAVASLRGLEAAAGPDAEPTRDALWVLASILSRDESRLDETIALRTRIVEQAERLLGPDNAWTNETRSGLLFPAMRSRNFDRAEPIARMMVAAYLREQPESFNAAKAKARLARILLWRGVCIDEATELARQASLEAPLYERAGITGHFAAYHRAIWAEGVRQAGDPTRAVAMIEADIEAALAAHKDTVLPGWVRGLQLTILADALLDQGRLAEATECARAAWSCEAGEGDRGHPIEQRIADTLARIDVIRSLPARQTTR